MPGICEVTEMKRSDVYIIYSDGSGKKAVKVKGYMFRKAGHWFTVRHRDYGIPNDSRYKTWIISDFVTGLIMTSTDNRLDDVPDALPEAMIDKLIEFYSDNSTSIYERQSTHDWLEEYAQMINEAMYMDNPENKLIDLLQEDAGELFR